MLFICKAFAIFVAGVIVLSALTACIGENTKEINSPSGPMAPVATTTAMPESFKCKFVVSDGRREEERYFIARKGDKWRVDIFYTSTNRWTTLKADRLYSIDHQNQVYAETLDIYGSGGKFANDDAFGIISDMTNRFFKQEQYANLKEIARENGLRKYENDLNGDNRQLIWVDEKTGMVTRREFPNIEGRTEHGSPETYIYELKGLSTDVDDSMFEVPAGYQLLTWEEYSPPLKPR